MDMPERYLIAAERAGMVLRMRGARLRGEWKLVVWNDFGHLSAQCIMARYGVFFINLF